MGSSPASHRRVGVLDIGSNSVRFVIYEIFGAAFTSIYNEKVLAGLGRDLRETGRLSASGRDEALEAIKRFKAIADAHSLEDILIAATAAMRMANDAPDFINAVKAQTGWDISPLPGEEEARLTALGVIAAEPRAAGIAADLGGASLELIHIEGGHVHQGESFPIGPFQMLGGDLSSIGEMDLSELKSQILSELDVSGFAHLKGMPLYLIGGAWRNLAIVHQVRHLYPLRTVQAYALMPGMAHDLADWAAGSGREDLLNWPGIATRRAETMPFGGLMLQVLLEALTPPSIILSATGLREGMVYDWLSDDLKSRDALLDGCRDLASGNLQGLNFAEPLFRFLEPLAEFCPSVFEPANEERLRRAACHLVGIGKGLHPDYRAALVFDDVLYAPLSGLTHQERADLAMILFHSFTTKSGTPNDQAIGLLLSRAERNAARIYGTAIRLAVVASGRSPELLDKFTLAYKKAVLTLSVNSNQSDLMSSQVTYRLEKLGQILGVDTEIQK